MSADHRHPFDLETFLPYLLNQAAESAGLGFQDLYKARYGMLRTEWRVLFHLGQFGPMTATQICERARLHKTKVSRAVKALEFKRFLEREAVEHDRRHELLNLLPQGQAAFQVLARIAADFDRSLAERLGQRDADSLRRMLRIVAGM